MDAGSAEARRGRAPPPSRLYSAFGRHTTGRQPRPTHHARQPPLDARSSAPLTSGDMAAIEPSKRLQVLPRYLFAELERKRHEAESAGREVFDLSIGDP